jgi:hypothetical protein
VGLCVFAVAQDSVFVPSNDIAFTVHCEQPAYKIGESIKIDYTIRNISNAAMFVPRSQWGTTCGELHFWAWFEDSSGKHFIPGYAGSCLGSHYVGVQEWRAKDAKLLQPGETLKGYFMLETNTFQKELQPGPYRIEAVVYGWPTNRFRETEKGALVALGHPLLRGERPASTVVELAR